MVYSLNFSLSLITVERTRARCFPFAVSQIFFIILLSCLYIFLTDRVIKLLFIIRFFVSPQLVPLMLDSEFWKAPGRYRNPALDAACSQEFCTTRRTPRRSCRRKACCQQQQRQLLPRGATGIEPDSAATTVLVFGHKRPYNVTGQTARNG